jgi:hypothetical protein
MTLISNAAEIAVHARGNTSIWTIASLAALLKTERCVLCLCRDSTGAHRWVSFVDIGLLTRLCVWCALFSWFDIVVSNGVFCYLFVINFAVKYNQFRDTTEVLPPTVDGKLEKLHCGSKWHRTHTSLKIISMCRWWQWPMNQYLMSV